jgi:hypothetical protein
MQHPSMYFHRIAALASITLASLAVRLLPFHWLARSAVWGRGDRRVDANDTLQAAELARIVLSASRRAPWRVVCLQEGLALQWLLRLRGFPSLFHFGIGSGDEGLSAHVWVSLNGQILIGADEAGAHARVASFPRIGSHGSLDAAGEQS